MVAQCLAAAIATGRADTARAVDVRSFAEEPRRDYVSTLEAIADVLPALGESEQARDNLRRLLRTLLQRARDLPNRRAEGGAS
jgi:hypothetical protein